MEEKKKRIYEARAEKAAADKDKEDAEARFIRAEQRADKSIRQNRHLLIATVILGACGLIVDFLANLEVIMRNLALLLSLWR